MRQQHGICWESMILRHSAEMQNEKSTVRTIHEIDIRRIGEEIRFTYTGNGFLQNMIRILTGTLVDVGCGVYPPERVAEILASKIRAEAGPTMPAQGLTLWEVIY